MVQTETSMFWTGQVQAQIPVQLTVCLTTHLISILRKDKDVQVQEHVSVVDKCVKLQ